MFRMCIGHRIGEKRGKIGYEYGKVGYPTHILALPKSQPIHKNILYLTLLINFLAATPSFNAFVWDSASRGKRRLGRNLLGQGRAKGRVAHQLALPYPNTNSYPTTYNTHTLPYPAIIPTILYPVSMHIYLNP